MRFAVAVVVVVVLSGCSLFLDGGAIDGGVDPTPATECPMSDRLVACYLFEGDGDDGSANGNHADNVVGVEFDTGVVDLGAVFSEDDRMTVSEAASSLDVTDVTMEVWVLPRALALDRRAIFDSNGEYSLFIDNTGRVECNGGGDLDPAGQLSIGEWSHVACTIRQGGVKVVYIDGAVVATAMVTTAITTGTNDIDIGSDAPYQAGNSHFVGTLDNLFIWNVNRTRLEICETAGLDCGQ